MTCEFEPGVRPEIGGCGWSGRELRGVVVLAEGD